MEQKPTQKEALEMLKNMNVAFSEQNLVWYIQEADFNKVELLLIAGINPNAPFIDAKKVAYYPFLNAVRKGNIKMLELLLRYGADKEIKDSAGNSSVFYTIANNSVEALEFLIKTGIDINIKNNEGMTALFMAEKNNKKQIAEILRNAGAKEMSAEEKTEYSKKQRSKNILMGAILIGCICLAGWICNGKHSSSSSHSSGSSTSSGSKTCTWCGKSYSGNGYNHLGGSGAASYCAEATNGWEKQNQCCSSKCCEEQWRSRH